MTDVDATTAAANLLRRASHVVVPTGAGASAESGVPASPSSRLRQCETTLSYRARRAPDRSGWTRERLFISVYFPCIAGSLAVAIGWSFGIAFIAAMCLCIISVTRRP